MKNRHTLFGTLIVLVPLLAGLTMRFSQSTALAQGKPPKPDCNGLDKIRVNKHKENVVMLQCSAEVGGKTITWECEQSFEMHLTHFECGDVQPGRKRTRHCVEGTADWHFNRFSGGDCGTLTEKLDKRCKPKPKKEEGKPPVGGQNAIAPKCNPVIIQ